MLEIDSVRAMLLAQELKCTSFYDGFHVDRGAVSFLSVRLFQGFLRSKKSIASMSKEKETEKTYKPVIDDYETLKCDCGDQYYRCRVKIPAQIPDGKTELKVGTYVYRHFFGGLMDANRSIFDVGLPFL
jgi:archaellum biogenesis ATPase FlaH